LKDRIGGEMRRQNEHRDKVMERMNSELRRQIDGVKGQIDEQREEIRERNGCLEGQWFQRSRVQDALSYVQLQAQPQPQKQRVFTGVVTKLHDDFDFVELNVFFQLSAVKGKTQKMGNRVLVEATYNASMPFK